jgi:hypothetical protein
MSEQTVARVRDLLDEWTRDLEGGHIVTTDARYCWGLAIRELRRALGDDS